MGLNNHVHADNGLEKPKKKNAKATRHAKKLLEKKFEKSYIKKQVEKKFLRGPYWRTDSEFFGTTKTCRNDSIPFAETGQEEISAENSMLCIPAAEIMTKSFLSAQVENNLQVDSSSRTTNFQESSENETTKISSLKKVVRHASPPRRSHEEGGCSSEEEDENDSATLRQMDAILGDFSEDEESEMTCYQKFVRKILPHLALVLLTLVFTLVGATIFYNLEGPQEQQEKRRALDSIAATKRRLVADLWAVAHRKPSTIGDFQSAADDLLDELGENFFDAFEKGRVVLAEIRTNQTTEIWTFPVSVFFAVTCLSTIGYGNPVPSTLTGRWICIFFALFGVPLFLITIANIGKFFSEHLIWLYGFYLTLRLKFEKNFVTFKLSLKEKTRNEKNLAKLKKFESNIVGSPEDLESNKRWEKNVSPADEMTDRNSLAEQIENALGVSYQEKTVPPLILLVILVGYTALGGLLLSNTESWNFFDSFYYSFITMTTIGFGDLVPLKSAYIFIILLYIVIGLIITTMCIDLVGIHYVKKIHYFGRKIQDARSALAIVGGKVVYISDLYAQLLARRYGIPRNQAGFIPDSYILEQLLSSKHMIPYIPRDIRIIRYIDENSDTLSYNSTSTVDYFDVSCRHCHYRANRCHRGTI